MTIALGTSKQTVKLFTEYIDLSRSVNGSVTKPLTAERHGDQ